MQLSGYRFGNMLFVNGSFVATSGGSTSNQPYMTVPNVIHAHGVWRADGMVENIMVTSWVNSTIWFGNCNKGSNLDGKTVKVHLVCMV